MSVGMIPLSTCSAPCSAPPIFPPSPPPFLPPAIPSLRARDCSEREKSALNYLFLAVPLVNVTLPLVWKSFAAVWTADVITFLAFYAWKVGPACRHACGLACPPESWLAGLLACSMA